MTVQRKGWMNNHRTIRIETTIDLREKGWIQLGMEKAKRQSSIIKVQSHESECNDRQDQIKNY